MSALKQRAIAQVSRLFGHSATVAGVRALSPRVRVIRLQGDSLRDLSWQPGHKIKLRVNDVMRSYTPARVDPRAGWMDIVFFLHGNGPAAMWANTAQVGQDVSFIGPARSMPGQDAPVDWAVFVGDETALGLAAALIEALPPGTAVLGAIESAAADAPAIAALDLPLCSAVRQAQHGAALTDWLADTSLPDGDGIVWLSGEATSVLALRTALLARGLSRQQLKIKPYWSVKGHAHRKSLSRDL